MRALPKAPFVALAAALLAWNAKDSARPGGAFPAAAPQEELAARASAARPWPGPSTPHTGPVRVAVHKGILAAEPPSSATGAAALPSPTPRTPQSPVSGAPGKQRTAEGPPIAGARQLAVGSPDHAAAIAAHLGSAQHLDAAGPVARLYLVTFDRAPDAEGYDHYIGERARGASLESMADEFAGSREFGMRFGELDDAAFVDRLLANSGLAIDAAQRAAWIAQLAAGQLDRGEVMIAISESAAFRQGTANEVYVIMAFHQALARPPSPAEVAQWSARLDAGYALTAMVQELLRQRDPRR